MGTWQDLEEKLSVDLNVNGKARCQAKHLKHIVGCEPFDINNPPERITVAVMHDKIQTWRRLSPEESPRTRSGAKSKAKVVWYEVE